MNKKERAQHWDATLSSLQQAQDTSRKDGFLTDQALSQRQIEKNHKRDQGLAEVEKARARVIVEKWKGIDAERQDKLAEQRRQQARQQQGLREQYPDLFPTPVAPKKPA